VHPNCAHNPWAAGQEAPGLERMHRVPGSGPASAMAAPAPGALGQRNPRPRGLCGWSVRGEAERRRSPWRGRAAAAPWPPGKPQADALSWAANRACTNARLAQFSPPRKPDRKLRPGRDKHPPAGKTHTAPLGSQDRDGAQPQTRGRNGASQMDHRQPPTRIDSQNISLLTQSTPGLVAEPGPGGLWLGVSAQSVGASAQAPGDGGLWE
jgi:hypothetical protein